MKNLIKQIEHNNGKFPREQLQQIIERKDEAIPELIEILEEVKENPYIKILFNFRRTQTNSLKQI